MGPKRFITLVAGLWLLILAVYSVSFWLNSPDLETRRRYATAINRQAATALWEWNINSNDAPGHSHK